MDDREAVNHAVAEHVERLRASLDQGKAEIDRQHSSLDDTRDHIAAMRRWQEGRDDAT